MNGTVTVFCVKHQIRVQIKNDRPWHDVWGVAGYCDSEKFTVRRENEVGVQSALQELRLAERAKPRRVKPS